MRESEVGVSRERESEKGREMYGERVEERETVDIVSTYRPVKNFCAMQLMVFQEYIHHKGKSSTLVPEYSLLLGLTLESLPLHSISDD